MRPSPGLALLLVALLVPGCILPGQCKVTGTSLTWTENTVWPHVPLAGQHGAWAIQRESEPRSNLPINHSRTPGWDAEDGLPLQKVWWRPPSVPTVAQHTGAEDFYQGIQPPPGWVVLSNQGYSQPDGGTLRVVEAEVRPFPVLSDNESADALAAFVRLVSADANGSPDERTTSSGSLFVVPVEGPLRLEELYGELVRPMLLGGDMGETFVSVESGLPFPPIYVPVGDWVFEFAEEQASGWDGRSGLEFSSQGATSLSVDGEAVSEPEMKRWATKAYSDLGLGKPSFDGVIYRVVEDCPTFD